MIFERALRAIRPGLIAGAADDDPSSIFTYAIAGSSAGYSMVWVAVIATPMMAVLLGMSARIAMVTGDGLMAAIRRHLPRVLALPLALAMVGANTFNIGADLGGMATRAQSFLPAPPAVYAVAFGVTIAIAQARLSPSVFARVFTFLSLILFALFGSVFIVAAVAAHPAWSQIAAGAASPYPRIDGAWLETLLAVLGATITPYLFIWEAAHVTARSGVARNARAMASVHRDINAGMVLANAVAGCIMIAFAGGSGLGVRSAFSIVTICSGMLAVPVLARTSAFVVEEMFGSQVPRDTDAWRSPAVLTGAGILVGAAIAAGGHDTVALVWAAILNGLVAVPLVIAVVWIASSTRIMGIWRSSRIAAAWGWLTAVVAGFVSAAAVYARMTHPFGR